jgi:hypothetical protein
MLSFNVSSFLLRLEPKLLAESEDERRDIIS